MSGEAELLVLRLALIGVIFVFVAVVAVSLRGTFAQPLRAAEKSGPRGSRLVVVSPGESGLSPGDRFVLAGSMLIGRDARAGIVLPDASVSARQAVIERVEQAWRVRDLGSTNGTFVEGRRVAPRGAMLRGGEKLAFGNVVLQLESD